MIDEELGVADRALLQAGRDRLGPDAATISRLRARVDGAVAGGTATTGATLAKLGLVAVVVAAIVALVAIRRDAQEPPSVAAPQITVADPDPAPHAATGAHEAPAPVAATPVVTAAPPPHVVQPAEPSRPAPRVANLAREIELVDRATMALHRRDLPGVIETIRIYDAETARRGQLAQDAAAIEIEALCRAGNATAAAKLDTFDHRWPRSAQRSRLTEACADTTHSSPL